MPKKIDYKKLEEQLAVKRKNCFEVWDDKVKKEVFDFADGYKQFLNSAKTEREAVRAGVKIAEANGFKNIEIVKNLKAGDKVYFIQQEKSVIFAKMGKKKLSEGFKMLMAHIDSPRLDLKVSPLYEDENLAFLKTHYYGGIKKYQWPTICLALHGKVCLENGKKIEIVIGEEENDPIFMITDLLPHLDREGGAGSAIKNREVKGEDLNLLVGSIPVRDEKVKEKVKLAVLEFLYNKHGIKEEDLSSCDLCAVPSGKSRDLGFDRSLIAGYGHDDKVCAYPSLIALVNSKNFDNTEICVFIDREEIGSEGSTGARSIFIESFISRLLELSGESLGISDVYKVFAKSKAISADVTAAVDPDYKEVYDLRNAHRMGFGLAIEKYTGSGGKSNSSEASADLLQELRIAFKKNKNILYQLGGGIGKIDLGGGGTIAKELANRNIEVVDMGVPVFNMHAPIEIISKADLYSVYLGYKAFLG